MISSGGTRLKLGALDSMLNCMTPAERFSMSKESITWSQLGLLGDPM